MTTFDHDSVGNITSITDPRGNTTTFQFDDERRQTQREEADPFNFITNYVYNDNGWLTAVQRETSDPANPWQTFSYAYTTGGKLLTVIDPVGRPFNFAYDQLGRLVSKTDAESRVWQFAYSAISQVVTVTDPMGVVAERRTYTPNDRLATTTDANNNTTTFQRDGFDRLEKTIYPDLSFEQFTFDENSNVLTQQTRKGDTITNTFDPLNRIETRDPDLLPLQTLTYDLAGRMTKISTPVVVGDPTSGDYQFFFDTAGRLVEQRTPATQNVTYELDENGNRMKLTWPDSYFAEYVFDELNRLTDIKLNGSSTAAIHFAFDALSRRTATLYENGCECTYSYWLNDDLSMLAHNLIGSSVSFAFGYNRVHQLTNLLVSDESYLLSPETSKLTVYGPANNLNQYPDVSLPYQYDENGCLTADGINTFSFDVLSRLVEVERTGLTNTYLYDPLNRQGQKVVDDTVTPVTANYLYDLGEVIAEYGDGGSLQNRYIRGPFADELFVKVAAGGTVTFLHHDRLGSIIAATNSSGAVVNKYQYSPFGETPALPGIIFGYTGQRFDAEFSLYNYKARYYAPHLGRFLQPDPIGYTAGDLNLYTYAAHDAVNGTDPYGTFVKILVPFPRPAPTPIPAPAPIPGPCQPGIDIGPRPVPPDPVSGAGTGPGGKSPTNRSGGKGSQIYTKPSLVNPEPTSGNSGSSDSGSGGEGEKSPEPPRDPNDNPGNDENKSEDPEQGKSRNQRENEKAEAAAKKFGVDPNELQRYLEDLKDAVGARRSRIDFANGNIYVNNELVGNVTDIK